MHGYSVEDGAAPAALETRGLFLLATVTAGGEGMVITVLVARIDQKEHMCNPPGGIISLLNLKGKTIEHPSLKVEVV